MSVSYNLPNEMLEKIFNFCDVYTLSQISMVCIQFNNVAKYILKKKSEHLLVTNQKSEKFCERCKPLLSLYQNSIFIINYNWIHKECKRRQIYKIKNVKKIYLEQRHFYYFQYKNRSVQMTKNIVWFFCQGEILAFKRAENGTIKKGNILKTDKAFIETFAHCDNYIISGDREGIINRWEIKDNQNDFLFKRLKIHNVHYNIDQIDATSQHIITSSEHSIKILKYTDDRKGCTVENEIFCGDTNYIQSILFDPIGTKFAATLDYYSDSSFKYSFLIYDIDKSCQVININIDYSCHQILWEDPYTILMNYGDSIKKMDLRTSEIVRTWDSSKYGFHTFCCSSDNMNTFMTGCQKSVLWDQRQSVAIQTYDVDGSDIYHLEFDSTHMYATTGECLFELDFTNKNHFNHKKIKTFFGNFY
ncbi:uncharacterized protein [Linepithema humile]|uniref:uncharacterized protein isoform X1 n=1 Tax=Linepithema humile TaxID=83485 RepID=UPI00351E4F02